MYKKHSTMRKIVVCLVMAAAMGAVQNASAAGVVQTYPAQGSPAETSSAMDATESSSAMGMAENISVEISMAGNPEQTSPAETTPVQGVRVLFIGDSITDGNWGEGGGAKPSAERNHWDQNHIFGSGYMYLCAAYYGGRFPEAGLEFFNRGISGEGVADLAARWEEDVLAMRPDVLSVLVGINDVHRFVESRAAVAEGSTVHSEAAGTECSTAIGAAANSTSLEDTAVFDIAGWESVYRDLLDRARAQNPDLLLVLCAPFTSRPEYREAMAECARAVERMAADYGAVFMPYDAMFEGLTAETSAVPATHWLWDGIHPTAAGHARMAELWIVGAGSFWE